jgi:hypothetical protein
MLDDGCDDCYPPLWSIAYLINLQLDFYQHSFFVQIIYLVTYQMHPFPKIDWKTVIYIYVCGKCPIQFMMSIRADDNSSTCTFTTEKSVACTGACANEIIPNR